MRQDLDSGAFCHRPSSAGVARALAGTSQLLSQLLYNSGQSRITSTSLDFQNIEMAIQSKVDPASSTIQEFDSILKYLGTCRPYHSNQEKSASQLKLEQRGTGLLFVIGGCFALLLVLLGWKKLDLPTNEWFFGAALAADATSQVLALPWLGFNIAAACIECRNWNRKSGRLPRDLCLRETEQDEHHARGLNGYSDSALIRVRHYLGCKTGRTEWIASPFSLKILGGALSLAGPYALRHQLSPAAVGQYVRDHGIAGIRLIGTVSAFTVIVIGMIWGIYDLIRHRGGNTYHLRIMDLAISLKQAGAKSGPWRNVPHADSLPHNSSLKGAGVRNRMPIMHSPRASLAVARRRRIRSRTSL